MKEPPHTHTHTHIIGNENVIVSGNPKVEILYEHGINDDTRISNNIRINRNVMIERCHDSTTVF
jgi:hypothetical protein